MIKKRESSKQPKVAIIILNWNGWKDTIECLESVYQISYPNYDVIAVDNSSKDNSIEKIKEYCKGKIVVKSKFFKYNSSNKPIKIIEHTKDEVDCGLGKSIKNKNLPSQRKLFLIKNEKNHGFAEGNNVGISYALKVLNPDYVFLLNNDTIVEKDCVSPLIDAMEGDKKIGVSGGTLYYFENDNLIQNAGQYVNLFNGKVLTRGNQEVDIGQFNHIHKVDFICGAGMMIRTATLKKIGLLDKTLFLLCEDTDFCLRAEKASCKVMFVPGSKIVHKGSQSINTIGKNHIFYDTRNKIWLVFKFGTITQQVVFSFYHVIIKIPKMVGWCIINNRNTYTKEIFRGTFEGFFSGVYKSSKNRNISQKGIQKKR